MLIELHIIQNFAPSCLNRDDTNAPKDCEFGGVRRARISSQCLKRAARWSDAFQVSLSEDRIARRTRLLKDRLTAAFIEAGQDQEDADSVADKLAGAVGSKITDGRTSVALYFSDDEVKKIAALANEKFEDWKKAKADAVKKLVKTITTSIPSRQTDACDVALFGRMIADHPALNVDAACQVAHALSTNTISMEMDFFTAVDDLQPEEDSGAGMMGTQEFNSACFYRYSNVDVDQLASNLQGDQSLAKQTALAYVRAAVLAIPDAKQNSHAAQNPPDFVMAVVRKKGQAISLANAFVQPIRQNQKSSLVDESVKALLNYWEKISRAYDEDGYGPLPFYTLTDIDTSLAPNTQDVKSLKGMLDTLQSALSDWEPR